MSYLEKLKNEYDKLDEAQRKYSARCKCSNRVPYGAFERFGNYAVCEWCGHRVYRTAEEQRAYDEQQLKEYKARAFRKQMEKLLKSKRRNKNGKRKYK